MTAPAPSRGFFLTLEGPDGAGKTTQGQRLAEHLRARGLAVLHTREPGGTSVGERVRAILLDETHREMAPETEMFLFAAARAQHVREVIRPALARGITVLSERYVEASLAYQGVGRGLGIEVVRAVNAAATGGLDADLVILLDVDAAVGLARARRTGGKAEGRGDRMEQEALAFYQRVREGFHQLARESPQRIIVVDAGRAVEDVHRAIAAAVDGWLAGRPAAASERGDA